jgi:hypothetical protein
LRTTIPFRGFDPYPKEARIYKFRLQAESLNEIRPGGRRSIPSIGYSPCPSAHPLEPRTVNHGSASSARYVADQIKGSPDVDLWRKGLASYRAPGPACTASRWSRDEPISISARRVCYVRIPIMTTPRPRRFVTPCDLTQKGLLLLRVCFRPIGGSFCAPPYVLQLCAVILNEWPQREWS